MKSRFRKAGVVLMVAAGVVLAVGLPTQALVADDEGFNRLAGWANILALSFAVLGVGLWFAERWMILDGVPAEAVGKYLDELAAHVLEQESRQRAALLGSDSPSIVAANVQFDRLISFRQVDGDHEGDLAGIGDFYTGHTSGRMVILGAPGSGKTVLSLELLVQLLEERAARPAPDRAALLVPFRMSLPGWNTDQPFEHWLSSELQARHGMAGRVADALVRQRRILPVLDGLDEMDNTDGPATRAAAAVAHLNQYLVGRAGAPLVIACRTGDYARLDTVVRPAVQIRIRPLTAVQVTDYLRSQSEVSADPAGWRAWQPVLDALGTDPGAGLLAQINTPWRMMLAVTYQRDGGDLHRLLPADGEPTGEGSAYAARTSELLLRQFVPARTRLCEPGRYQSDEVLHWLRHIAVHLAWQADQGGSGTDVIPHEWWPSAGLNRVRRWHTAAAVLLVLIGLAILGLVVNAWSVPLLVGRVQGNLANLRSMSGPDILGGAGFALFALVLPLSAAQIGRQTACEPAKINIQQVRTHRGRRQLIRSILSFTAFGVPLAILSGLTYGFAVGHTSITVWIAYGLAISLTVGSVLGVKPAGAVVLKPYDQLRNDFTIWVGLGISSGLALSLSSVSGDAFGFGPALVFGVAGGTSIALALGFAGNAALRYFLATVLAARAATAPLRFAAFLAWAYRAGILRISGNAYQLRHNELRDWLRAGPGTDHPAETAVAA